MFLKKSLLLTKEHSSDQNIVKTVLLWILLQIKMGDFYVNIL